MKNVLMRGVVDTVYSVQNTVRDVLPGNPLNRDYEILHKVGSAGSRGMWAVYSAVRRSNKQKEASVFVLEKKNLGKYDKQTKEAVLERFRRSVQMLARIKHPHVLSVQQTLEESRDSIAFASEPVKGSLSDAIERHESFSDVEIRYGLLQMSEALLFLHKDARIVHGNICPSSILVATQSLQWKLACFEFGVQGKGIAGSTDSSYPVQVWMDTDKSDEISSPDPAYRSPECIQNRVNERNLPQSDVYSLGLVTYALYNHGKELFPSEINQPKISKMKRLSTIRLSLATRSGNEQIENALMGLLRFDPAHRTIIAEFIKIEKKLMDELRFLSEYNEIEKA
ncbi:hypothetical protein ACOME3_003333 [Neoechinorhynchus agilis]